MLQIIKPTFGNVLLTIFSIVASLYLLTQFFGCHFLTDSTRPVCDVLDAGTLVVFGPGAAMSGIIGFPLDGSGPGFIIPFIIFSLIHIYVLSSVIITLFTFRKRGMDPKKYVTSIIVWVIIITVLCIIAPYMVD